MLDRRELSPRHLVLAYLFCFACALHAPAQDQPVFPANLDPKVIEKMSKDLERQMRELVRNANQAPQVVPASPPAWLDKDKWLLLEKGATPDAVRQLFGEPTATKTLGTIEVWSYGLPTGDRALKSSEVVGRVSFQKSQVSESSVDPQRLSAALARWETEHGGKQPADAQPGKATTVTPRSLGAGLPNYLELSNWELVAMGMPPEQVVAILGEPTSKYDEGNRWVYRSEAQPGAPLGQVMFMMGNCFQVIAKPSATQLEAELAFWKTHGLRTDNMDGPDFPGRPAWTILSNWNKVKQGMSADEVQAILGKPSWLENDTLVYADWSLASRVRNSRRDSILTLCGTIELNQDRKVLNTLPPTRVSVQTFIALLKTRGAQGQAWPQWADPAAWVRLRKGQSPEEIENILGVPYLKSSAVYGKPNDRSKWTYRFETIDKPSAEIVLSGDEFPDLLSASPPDYGAVLDIVGQRGVAADIPAWTDESRWIKLDFLIAASTYPPPSLRNSIWSPTSNDTDGEPSVEWIPATGPFSGLWAARWTFDNGGVIHVVTPYLATEGHPSYPHGFMNEVKVPEMFETEPTVSRKQDANGLGSRLSIAYKMWSRIKHPMDTGGSHSLQSLYNLLGVPQRFEWVSDHPAAQRMLALKEVSHEESVAQTLLLHYGDGHVAVMPTKVQRGESLPPNPNLQIRVVGISRASAAAMAAGTQSQSWPVFGPSTHVPDQVGRPFFLDSARYKHIQTGDPIAWVLYVLGLPTAVERVGEERDPAGFTTLKYGPVEVAGEKWFSGKIRINRSGAVIGIEAPTKK